MLLLKPIMYLGGSLITVINSLPLPWKMKLAWARFLYLLSVKMTGSFPSIWNFVESQNVTYRMGKGESSYQPILQLQKILKYCSDCEIPVEEIREVVALSESEHVPDSRLAFYIARKFFDDERATKVLRISARDSQTW